MKGLSKGRMEGGHEKQETHIWNICFESNGFSQLSRAKTQGDLNHGGQLALQLFPDDRRAEVRFQQNQVKNKVFLSDL